MNAEDLLNARKKLAKTTPLEVQPIGAVVEAKPKTEEQCSMFPQSLKFFNETTQTWEPIDPKKQVVHSSPSFTMLCMNVWMVYEVQVKERLDIIVQLIKEKKVDFVCFQEWTLSAQREAEKNEYIRKHFYMLCEEDMFPKLQMSHQKVTVWCRRKVEPEGKQSSGYLTVSGCFNIDVPHYFRKSIAVKLASHDGKRQLVFCSVHLESVPGKNMVRKAQLGYLTKTVNEKIFSAQEKQRTFILCGDFNFNFVQEEAWIKDCGFVDAWPTLRPKDQGMTYHGNTGTGCKRYDRICINQDRKSALQRIELGCVKPFEEVPQKKFVSDHFALVAQIKN